MPELATSSKLKLASAGGGCCGGAVPPNQAEPAEVKTLVQDYYAKAVTGQRGGCCTKGDAATLTIPQMAGYRDDVLSSIPTAAAEKSFGCGDPLAFSDVKPGETVLDIGSGAGIDCFIAAQKVGPTGKVIGLDMTPAMLEAARRNASQGGYTNVEFRQGEAENMPVADASVDWVISNCVINLSPDKAKVFAEIQRVLKPGGRISISDIVADALPDFIRNDTASYCGCVGGAIPTADYLRLLTQAGLVDVKVETRLDYDAGMVRGFVLGDESLKERYGPVIDANPQILEQVKIASTKVAGRKPLPNEQPTVTLRPAAQKDYPVIVNLLQASNLPEVGLSNALANALVAEHNGHLIGALAMERFGHDGLLRSFVVAAGWRGRKIGKLLWNALVERAQQSGVKTFYLLTTTIAEMAAAAGFQEIARDDVPPAVRASAEFSLNACATATSMRLQIAD
jgi:SAM-dependent methyltransferase